ncbi:MAG: cation-translocating P-type ATPase [Deltaproteobacteria bacterium]|nr:cation-translocating P-type ATPase [Deltaproteobacteria bacterium]MBI3388913.1 cation-translocating P-type ATPase [Deltaproteobacteria bacterium]
MTVHAALQPPIDAQSLSGLTQAEAARRLEADGFNEIPAQNRRSAVAMVAGVLREPMLLLLLATGAIYLALGTLGEALMLLVGVCLVIAIELYQEHKTERALEALRDLTSPRALVIRDAQPQRIPGREVVRGDLLILSEGDRVPADAALLSATHLWVDESLLTGESLPVRKSAHTEAATFEPGDEPDLVYSGTLVTRGHGIARAEQTGMQTEIGKVGRRLQSLESGDTLLRAEMKRIVRIFAVLGIGLCVVVSLLYALTIGGWLRASLVGISLAISMTPEEFPVVLAVFFALGAWRMSKRRVLTRRAQAIEALGAVTVLCVDKTGTLTLNQMSVTRLVADEEAVELVDGRQQVPEPFHALAEFMLLASQRDPFDPTELALKRFAGDALADTEHLHGDWQLVREYPLSNELLALSHVWRAPDATEYVIAAKGAPEAIVDLCHVNAAQAVAIAHKVTGLAEDGLRVLGVARAYFRQTTLPEQQHDFDFEFLGLVGLADPVRATVPRAIRECYDAGIRVVMLTGDYPGTAQNIARQIGLAEWQTVLTGAELQALDEAELARRIPHVNVFARIVPEQKLRLVNALKATGAVVAMTGDGVNDAPALKAAHIGIAMGGHGTDVAREAAAIVLLDDDFSSLVESVRMGRRIYDNLKRAMAYIFAVHIPIAGAALVPLLLKWPLVLLPVHLVFLELIIDPACSLGFEAEQEEVDIMTRPPRNQHELMFTRKMIGRGLLQGLGILVTVLLVFGWALRHDRGERAARALMFATLIVANLGLILINRSWSRTIVQVAQSPNRVLWWVGGAALALMILVLTVPGLRDLFQFAPLRLGDWALCLAAGVASVAWFEVAKLWSRATA